MDKVTIITYKDDMPLEGPGAPPKADCIEDLIIYLVTLRHRKGNVPIKYRIAWGKAAIQGIDLKIYFKKH